MATLLESQQTASYDINLHEKQSLFVASRAPTVVFQGGAGSGKTFVGAFRALYEAKVSPGSRGMIVAATFPMMRQAVVPHLETILDILFIPGTWRWNRTENCIYLSNGSLFWLRSATDPRSSLGADLAWVWGDEVGLWSEQVYLNLMSRLRQPGYQHRAWFTYTPKGRNWAWRVLGESREGVEVIHTATFENPHLPPDYLERLRREYGEDSHWWRQEVLGQFVAYEGLVYPSFDADACVCDNIPRKIVTTIAGVDWGWTNPGAIVVVVMNAEGLHVVAEEVVESQRPIDWWIQQAQRLMDKWQVERFVCDPSEPANIDAFRRSGLPAMEANNAVIPGIAAVNGLLENKRLLVKRECVETISEFAMYSWQLDRNNELRPDQPAKVRDHAMDALRYAIMALQKPSSVTAWKPVRAIRGW